MSAGMLPLSLTRRRGFSFAEVMFAVVILGIGFIMVAAIFPVAIQQTRASSEESSAAAAAREAANAIAALPIAISNVNTSSPVTQYSPFPPTIKNYVLGTGTGLSTGQSSVPPPPVAVPFVGVRWQMIQSAIIMNADSRYAFVPFYKRGNDSAAQLIIIAVAARNKSVYDPTVDSVNTVYSTPASVTTTASQVNSSSPPSASQLTMIYPDSISITSAPSNITEGCWVTNTLTNRTYTLGRPQALGYDVTPGDALELTAGTSGLWGTSGASIDSVGAASGTFGTPTTLQPTVAYATLTSTSDNPAGRITLYTSSTSGTPPAAAAPGAFVVVADDYPYDPASPTSLSYSLQPDFFPPIGLASATQYTTYSAGALNGRIFRLDSAANKDANGNALVAGTFNLDPDYGMQPGAEGPSYSSPYAPTGIRGSSPDTVPNPALVQEYPAAANLRVKVYIVGVAPDPSNTSVRSGGAQDIGAFVTYIPAQ